MPDQKASGVPKGRSAGAETGAALPCEPPLTCWAQGCCAVVKKTEQFLKSCSDARGAVLTERNGRRDGRAPSGIAGDASGCSGRGCWWCHQKATRCDFATEFEPARPYCSRLRIRTSRAAPKYGCQTISGRSSRRQSRTFCNVFRAMWGQRLHAQVSPVEVMIPGTGMKVC